MSLWFDDSAMYSVIAPEWGAVRKGLAARLERPSGGRDAHDPA
jgi:hypothetical protein